MSQAIAPVESLPEGTIAFLYTDIEGSTRMWQEHGAVMADVVLEHDRLLRSVVDRHRGVVFRTVGDGVCAAFSRAGDAVLAAIDAQRALQGRAWEDGLKLNVRMAIHVGSAEVRDGEYVGHTLNRVARLLSAAHGGQVLLSSATEEIVRDDLPAGSNLRDLGKHRLKDLTRAEHIYQILAPELLDVATPLVSLPEHGEGDALALPTGGYLGSLPAGPLMGRKSEMARLSSIVEGVARGEGAFVLLAGEPGVGKTRLAQEITAHLHARGFVLAVGRCYAQEQAVPYYPFLDALAMAYRSAAPTVRPAIISRWPYLGRLLPDTADGRTDGRPADAGSPDEQQRLFRAVTGFLDALATTAPVGVMLDDLHWADSSSLDLLRHLARHTRNSRILLLGIYRDTDVDATHPLQRALLDLMRESLVERLPIPRLDPHSTAQYVAASLGATEVPTDIADLVYRPTEGNPLFVQQILQSMVERGDVYFDRGEWRHRELQEIEVPETVRDVISQRLARLSEGTQAVLAEASIVGQRFSFDEIQMLSEREEADLEDSLDEAEHMGLVRAADGDDYTFHHVLTQQTLYVSMPVRRRRRLHRKLGQALEDSPESERRAAELAWHYLQAGDTARALTWTLRSGDSAEDVFAHEEAERHYRQATRLADALHDPASLAQANARLGLVLRTVARYDEALASLESAARFYQETGDREREAEVLTQIGHAHYLRETSEEGAARLLAFVAAVDRPDGRDVSPAGLSALYAILTLLLFAGVRYAEQLRAAERSSELAREAADDRALARAEVARGVALLTLGRRPEAIQVMNAALPLAERSGELDSLARALDNLGNAYFFGGQQKRAEPYFRRGLEIASRIGDPAQIAQMTFMLGICEQWVGDWGRVAEYAERVQEIVSELGDSRVAALPHFALGQRAVWMGDWETAQYHLDEVVRLTEEPVNLPLLKWAHRHLAEIELMHGRPADALARLLPLAGRPGLQSSATVLAPIAQARLEMGNTPAAQETIDQALAHARAEGDNVDLLMSLRVAAMVAIRETKWDDGEAAIEEGLHVAEMGPFDLGRGWMLQAWGSLLASAGDLDAARIKLQEALDIFDHLGAQGYREQTAEALAELAPDQGSEGGPYNSE